MHLVKGDKFINNNLFLFDLKNQKTSAEAEVI